ncbi:hypothetical protein [Pantoea leporis]|uniref:hypothetical protein n=1 Tax=Pantoea leporis TaxID=2933780 RepID=UPI002302C864|nr:hypothetical protein [Pantoea leporis]
MKLMVKQYISSLREREELDAILPDLISQMGLNVFSVPRRGTLQNGVDVAAVGSIDGAEEAVYLFSIKSGDLTHNEWDGNAKQSLRPSLNEIIDTYIPSRLPQKYKYLPIKVCLCFGGDIREQVRTLVTGYTNYNTRGNIQFEEWNGDKISELIVNHFLNENLLPENLRFLLRKTLSFLDEPEVSFGNYSILLRKIHESTNITELTKIRQMNICFWMLYSWCREQNNLQSAVMGAEETLLLSWDLAKNHKGIRKKDSINILSTFKKILETYHSTNKEYIEKFIDISKGHMTISAGIYPPSSVSVNIKLFDIIGRISAYCMWLVWDIRKEKDTALLVSRTSELSKVSGILINIIENNPSLYHPLKDDNAIDLSLALFVLSMDSENQPFIIKWLYHLVQRSIQTLQNKTQFTCIINDYAMLIHNQIEVKDEKKFKKLTSGSIYYVILAFFSCLYEQKDKFDAIAYLKKEHLPHCNFQYWYLNDSSEYKLFKGVDKHGMTVSQIPVDKGMLTFISTLFEECDQNPFYKENSAVKSGLWPLIASACRRYRNPLPINLLKEEFEEEFRVILNSLS